MAEDASLDDFLDGGDSEDEGDSGSASGDDTGETESETTDAEASTDAEAASDAVEPAVTTYAWSPEGAACAECGEVVERRWTQGGVLVCGACKSW